MGVAKTTRLVTIGACVVLLGCLSIVILDLMISEPGFSLVPRKLEWPLLFAPLACAVLALVLAIVSIIQREPLQIRAWLVSALITFLYAFLCVWDLFFPMRVH